MENERSRFAVTAPKLALWVAVLTIVVGIVVLVGWTFDIEALKSVLPGWVAMKANTAVCFILTGVALYAVHLTVRGELVEPPASQLEPFDKLITSDLAGVVGQPSRMASSSIRANGNFSKVNSIGAALWLTARPHSAIRNQKSAIFLVRLCLLLAGLIGLLTLGEYIFDWNPGLDQWLFIEPNGTVGTSYPGRMAPETALSFVLLAAALWITGSSHQTRWTVLAAANFGLLVTALALAAMLSYLTPGIGSFGWFGLTIMAMNTAILFVILGITVTAMSWRQEVLPWSLGRNTTAAFACGMALLVFVGLNTSRSQFWMSETNHQIAHTEKMLVDVDNVLVGIIDAKVHSRDYLITGDEQFLKFYLSAKADSQAKLDALHRTEFASGEPEHQQHFTRIEAQVKAQFQLLQQIIDARRTGINEAARSNMFSHGEDLLNKFRSTLDQNKSDDRQIIEQLKREAKSVAQLSFLSIFIGTFVSLLIFLTVIFRLNSAVNERKRFELDKEQYLKFFKLSINPMCIADPYGRFKQVNPAFAKLTGYSESELVAKPFLDFVLPEDRENTVDEMKRQVEQRPTLHFDNRYMCNNGAVIDLSWTAYYDKNDGVTYATAADITERKKAEAALREKERLLSESQRTAHIGSWRFESADKMWWSDETYRIYGASPETFTLNAESFFNSMVPEDRPSMQEWIVACMAGKNPSALEFRITKPDGVVRCIRGFGDLQPGDKNKPQYLTGMVYDITERKLADAKLAEQLEELRRWHDNTMGREGRVLDLKQEVNELLVQVGQPPRYPSAELSNAEPALHIVGKVNPI